jgi:hypothetical protein
MNFSSFRSSPECPATYNGQTHGKKTDQGPEKYPRADVVVL